MARTGLARQPIGAAIMCAQPALCQKSAGVTGSFRRHHGPVRDLPRA
jgi:hypothetical protein